MTDIAAPLQTSPITRVVEWLTGLMETIGATGAALAVLLENVFPPIPSELILPLAGFAAAQGHFSLVSAIVWTTLGSVAGAWLLYWAGQVLGAERLRAIADRLPLAKGSDIDKAVDWFTRYGAVSVFVGRMVPGVRSLISVPAGLTRMSPLTFTLYSLAGSAIWNSVLILAGYELGANWELVEGWVSQVQKVVIAVLAALATWFVVHRVRNRHTDTSADAVQDADGADQPVREREDELVH